MTVGRLRRGQLSVLFEQHAKIERSVGMPALIGATIRLLGGYPLAALLEQHTEIATGAGVATFVGATVRLLRSYPVTLRFEQDPVIERGHTVTAVIHAMIVRDDTHVSVRVEGQAKLPLETTPTSRRRQSRQAPNRAAPGLLLSRSAESGQKSYAETARIM
jgi:hypothetical protein